MILQRRARFEFQTNVTFITDNCGKLLNYYGKVDLKLKQKILRRILFGIIIIDKNKS